MGGNRSNVKLFGKIWKENMIESPSAKKLEEECMPK